MKKEEFLKQIDHDSYVLKNKLMVAFDQNFGTELREKDADDLHFCDIMVAIYEKRPGVDDTMVYPVLKRTVGHGVTDAQKNFLYKYTRIALKNEPGEDLEDYIMSLRDNFVDSPESRCLACMKIGVHDDAGMYTLSIFQYPMLFVEFSRMVPKTDAPTEAILVQNGGVMIIRTVHDEKEMLENPFKGNSNFEIFGDRDDDDDDD